MLRIQDRFVRRSPPIQCGKRGSGHNRPLIFQSESKHYDECLFFSPSIRRAHKGRKVVFYIVLKKLNTFCMLSSYRIFCIFSFMDLQAFYENLAKVLFFNVPSFLYNTKNFSCHPPASVSQENPSKFIDHILRHAFGGAGGKL